jgi:hydrogenase maturation protease
LSKVLIIGYGNPLRSDDAVGWHAVKALKSLIPQDNVTLLSTHQLSPELAESLSNTKQVIFIDAGTDPAPGQIRITNLNPEQASSKPLHHHLTPEALLSYSASLYGNCPEGMLITIAGGSFEFGEELSKPVQNALPIVLKKVSTLVHEIKRKQDEQPS